MTNQTAVIEKLLTYDEVAELLDVSPRTVWNYVDQGKLLPTRFGGLVRIDPADLRTFIEKSKRQPTSLNTRSGVSDER